MIFYAVGRHDPCMDYPVFGRNTRLQHEGLQGCGPDSGRVYPRDGPDLPDYRVGEKDGTYVQDI